MAIDRVNTLIAFPEWLVAVTRRRSVGYFCWVITPELAALTDGEAYPTRQAALAAGRSLVHYSIGPQIDFSHCRLYE
ncbi:hypothetical protein [Nodosilinea sp. E11]|uniref:hypothetical protein n=1 Tax=Nodosilinea sp. E11 TaxID=3037479 RepID=UPI0029350B41|nr:hypothetical protein [Nodosilinea sp. E11]WOD39010.1 hypothetical protein RRF56_22655 [Nodosilinea sp. E11]